MQVVKAKVFNMDFRMEGFKRDNVEFRPLENYREIERKIRKEKRHYQTGVVTVEIPKEKRVPNLAIEYAVSLLDKYSVLLRFAHNHDVFFDEFDYCSKCIRARADKYPKPEEGYVWEQKELFGRRVGKATGLGANIHPRGIQEFFSTAMPKIQDEKFIEETGIYWALLWYNEAIAFDLNVVEIRFPALWIALEILANSYTKTNPRDFIITEEKWRELKERFSETCRELNIPRDKMSKLQNALGYARSGWIVDKVNYLLQAYGFSQYTPEIPPLSRMRNDILHGRRLNYKSKPSPIDRMRKLERLLVKLILKILDFYDRTDLIPASILEDDLLAKA
ncbi:hypothetical protein ES703_61185 [subsurface metagenome]